MLAELRISGLGVIDEAGAELSPGLTVLTGETGAGKTMVVTSLHLLGGARAEASRVRHDTARAVVEGRFTLDGAPVAAREEVAGLLSSTGGEADADGSVIAVRTVGRDGRSRAHLGGRSVPAGVLGEFTGALLTVHGQNDQLRLLRPERQREALDRFAGEAVAGPLAEYRRHRGRWVALRKELHEKTSRSRELAQEADRLAFGINEIDSVNPAPGEDAAIAADVRRLGDLDSLRECASEALAATSGAAEYGEGFDGGRSSALELLGAARARLESAHDPLLRELAPRLGEAMVLVGDVSAELGGYLSDLPADPSALESLLVRQAELKALTRKYAADVDGVIAWVDKARARLASLDVSSEALDKLGRQVDEAAARVAAAAARLSGARQAAAAQLAVKVSAELAGLAMGRARLEVSVAQVAAEEGAPTALAVGGRSLHAGPHGVDEVELRLAAHGGAQSLPIARSASGGELSRVMLALEVVLAAQDSGTTMVFDEVDAGVGGRAAVEIGRRLARLARTHQVIVVTHLPQVAAFADTHLMVDKADGDGGVVSSGVRTLDRDGRVAELARMLAGLGESETARAHAEELIAAADADRAAMVA